MSKLSIIKPMPNVINMKKNTSNSSTSNNIKLESDIKQDNKDNLSDKSNSVNRINTVNKTTILAKNTTLSKCNTLDKSTVVNRNNILNKNNIVNPLNELKTDVSLPNIIKTPIRYTVKDGLNNHSIINKNTNDKVVTKIKLLNDKSINDLNNSFSEFIKDAQYTKSKYEHSISILRYIRDNDKGLSESSKSKIDEFINKV